MLIAVYAGVSRPIATRRGNFHFERSPEIGESIDVEGNMFVVTKAWHTPTLQFAGPKFAILVQEQVFSPTTALVKDGIENVA